MWCRHSWNKVSETILPSAYEQMSEADRESAKRLMLSFFSKKVVIVFVCSKCGKMKTIVESHPFTFLSKVIVG